MPIQIGMRSPDGKPSIPGRDTGGTCYNSVNALGRTTPASHAALLVPAVLAGSGFAPCPRPFTPSRADCNSIRPCCGADRLPVLSVPFCHPLTRERGRLLTATVSVVRVVDEVDVEVRGESLDVEIGVNHRQRFVACFRRPGDVCVTGSEWFARLR